ncbi:MAG: intradiol ring-cleavage dioxygenase [Chloroflexota bacterium]
MKTNDLSRRDFIRLGLASTAGLILVACGGEESLDGEAPLNYEAPEVETAVQLEPTPQCDDHDETPAQTEGPFYTPNTPQRTSLLEEGINGTTLIVTGKVLTTDCQPIANAVIDFWHADDAGNYDNEGFRLRGHQFTDANGNYRLETIMPGLYPGRTRHIHVKLQGPNTRLLTTQIYFPGESGNADDGIFDNALLVDMVDGEAVFNFVLT